MRSDEVITRQFPVSPASGKRIIARAMLCIHPVVEALKERTVVIVAGTTNGYLAEEMLMEIGQGDGFSRKRFFRGITLPPGCKVSDNGRLDDESGFPGDVVIVNGVWKKGKTIFDVAESLEKGDVVIKGANAINSDRTQAAVYIGHHEAGTLVPVLQAAIGRRVGLYIPVGLEKRVPGDLSRIAAKINSPNSSGPRMFPICGNIITELEAVKILTGADCELVAAGGVGGAEGSCWLAVTGSTTRIEKAEALFQSLRAEPMFEL